METVRLDYLAGSEIHHTIADAIEKAGAEGVCVAFDFNGVEITVEGTSNSRLIFRDWIRAMQGMVEGNKVGPHPDDLTEAELANDARVKAENDARQAKREEKHRKQVIVDEATVAAALTNVPTLDLRDSDGWAKGLAANTDPYGRCIFEFAEAWGRLMQVEIGRGRNLIDIADECCSLADKKFGITGFMYGAAVSILAQTWRYGPDLNRWHNAKYGRADAEGTVNPAVMTISPKGT